MATSYKTLARADVLRGGTLVETRFQIATGAPPPPPPFDELVVVWRISQDPSPGHVRVYGDPEYKGGHAGMQENAFMCERALLSDHSPSTPSSTHRILLGPNDLIGLIRLLEEKNRSVHMLVIGIDGFTTNVQSIIGLKKEHPTLRLDITTMISFAYVENIDLPVFTVFQSSAQTRCLYNTAFLDDLGSQDGSAKLLTEYWSTIRSNKQGSGDSLDRPAWRNVQVYLSYEYGQLSHSCALCLRRYGITKALRLHHEDRYAKPFKCRVCIGIVRQRFRYETSAFATREELEAHQAICTLETREGDVELEDQRGSEEEGRIDVKASER
ncbi:hypothetical protein BCR34DRAFT_590754 [Clohesyomyces aquaticus]|uniref:C2H2-type domain-containing protein n=1 Tax=Clohesyomyces aquaticus TaxID=1231657 RepID=A0A1Y1Z7C6_9PLEO|nr:hypothetical protein BCR34DRAFT_590754 [Clohesyomyces aquaticus]